MPPGAPILVTIKSETSGVNLAIEDNGPGIDEKYLPLVFNRFFRSPNAPNMQGSGLGLYICKQIILAHNGQIKASSGDGKGTTVTIFLPFSS